MVRDMRTGEVVKESAKLTGEKGYNPEAMLDEVLTASNDVDTDADTSNSDNVAEASDDENIPTSDNQTVVDSDELHIDINGHDCIVISIFTINGIGDIMAVVPDYDENSEENQIVFYHYNAEEGDIWDIEDDIFDFVCEFFARLTEAESESEE